jgi:hypothetical protein
MVTSAADLMIRKSSSTSILTPNGTITIDVDFHTVIKRQLSFARHMLQYSWHRMPSATSRPTKRVFAEAISRYDKFMDLFIYWRWIQGNSSPTTHAISHLIPAPDVDLAWRTHILSPKQYKRYCMSKGLRRDITHPVDREAAEGPTDKHITSSLYKYVFKECLQICLCWFCCMDTAFPYCFGTPKKLIRQSLEAEVARRRDLKLDIPLDYAQRRCSRCSWHRGSSCRARDNYRPEASEYNEKDNDACLVFKGKRIVTLLPSHRDGEILKFPHERIHRNQQPSRSEPPLIRQGGLVPPPAHQYKRLRSAEDPFRDPEPTEESSQDEHSPRVAESQALEHYTAERANASSPLAPGGPSYSNASADNEMNIPEDHGQTAPSQRSLIADSSASSRTRPTPSRIFGKLLATTNEGDVWWSPPKPRPRADTSRGHVLATMPPLVENTDDE